MEKFFAALLCIVLAVLGGNAAAGGPEYTPQPAVGTQSFYTRYTAYFNKYQCAACHTSVPLLNVYGEAYKTAINALSGARGNQANVETALGSIEGADADVDGHTNGTELTALTKAYDAASTPPQPTLTTSQAAKTAAAPTVVGYTVTVTNKGAATDSFTLGASVVSGESWTTTIVGNANNLAAGASVDITVNVAIPGGATTVQSSVAQVTAVSQASASIAATPIRLTTGVLVTGARWVSAGGGNDSGNNCTNQALPCKTITWAMSQANSGSPGDGIGVFPGTYGFANGESFPIIMKSGVALVSANGTTNITVLDATGLNQPVLKSSGGNAFTTIRGFTIKGGVALAPSIGSNARGGAMVLDSGDQSHVERNIFDGNAAYGYDGIDSSSVSGGLAQGGAIYISGSPTVTDNIFRSNVAQGGRGRSWLVTDANNGGSGGNGQGGAIYALSGSSSATIVHNTFYGNQAIGGAGGNGPGSGQLGGSGGNGSIGAVSAVDFTIANNTFVNNSAAGGAGGRGDVAFAANGTGDLGAVSHTTSSGNAFTNNLFNANTPNDGDTGAAALIATDPLFHSAPTNLHIRKTSPASGAGATAHRTAADFDFVSRATPPAIGAFEATFVSTTTAVASSKSPSDVAENVTFTATVSPASGTPAGTVTFKDDTTAICTSVALASGQAQCSTSSLAAGLHSITAEYSGSADFSASTSPALTQTVSQSTWGLTVAVDGTGSGTVTSSPSGINCPGTCFANFNDGTSVTLSASPASGSVLAGWAGSGCSGTGGCTLTLNGPRGVNATFDTAPPGFLLTVTKAGTGGGTVSSSPAGIDCGPTCSATFNPGASVTLSATPASGSVFTGWSGACSGTGGCTVTVDAAKAITATFDPAAATSFTLSVTNAGGGTGTVTSSPAGINCGGACSADFSAGASVTLTAAAALGSQFVGWLGIGCSGTGTCTVTMDGAKSITAIFDNPPRLANISTRMQVLTGENVMIGGFIIGGSVAKTVVIRARGPSMAAQGVPGTLANPMLQLFSGQTQLAVNDNWRDAANATQIGASGFAPSNDLESAILTTLAPGPYTAIVTGAGGTTGVGIVEVFEVDQYTTPLNNIATRGQVLTGSDVMIGGFIIQGSGPQTVVVRARGPSMASQGVANPLANPMLQLFSGQTQLAVNDNWQDASNASQIQSSGFAPADTRESAIMATLNPGAYTAIVTGVGGTTGVAIVEVFTAP